MATDNDFDGIVMNKKLILISDDGIDYIEPRLKERPDDDKDNPSVFIETVVKLLPSSIPSILCVTEVSNDDKNSPLNIFGKRGIPQLKSFCTKNNIPLSLLRYGTLTG
jgi:hypothetical protein